MKRVLVLNQFALPREQGGGTRHADLFSRLEGWSARIVAGNRNHYSQREFTTSDPSFILLRVPKQTGGGRERLASWLAYCAQVPGIAWRERPDVVYGSTPHLLAPLTGWAVARAFHAAFVLEVRDLWPESFVAAGLLREGSLTHRLLVALEQFLVRHADEIIVVTPGWEDHFRSLGADMNHYTVVANGTEPYDLALDAHGRETLRAAYGLRGTTAVFAGAHGPKDGIDFILDAAAACPEITVLLVGDGPVKPAAVTRAATEGLSNVRFLDPVSKVELPSLLAACDIGIHAVAPLPVFRLGMSPNKLFDYLAAGLPVVSNAGEAITGFVHDGECGRIGDADALAEGLRSVASADDTTRQSWSDAGRSIVRERFSRTQAADRLERVLDATLPERTP